MKTIEEKTLNTFEFWGKAKENASLLTPRELAYISDFFCEGCEDEPIEEQLSAQDINDIFINRIDDIAGLLGYRSFEDLKSRKSYQKTVVSMVANEEVQDSFMAEVEAEHICSLAEYWLQVCFKLDKNKDQDKIDEFLSMLYEGMMSRH